MEGVSDKTVTLCDLLLDTNKKTHSFLMEIIVNVTINNFSLTIMPTKRQNKLNQLAKRIYFRTE